jgi:hypothetical protein
MTARTEDKLVCDWGEEAKAGRPASQAKVVVRAWYLDKKVVANTC